ncbi:type II secretion system protein GspM [Legionella spiritensis]|uniref:type II secretion system protein GspM n=1 Tax=Legionella spiritensis TaxID=452 RepID=UPI000F716F31|nr:type II secretion system protein GspM [Legionella spiritensis]VEG90644.1 general secretion pathway protein M [Legionella spiritensis]
MNSYWQNLNERERWMVGVALITVTAYLFYLFIYSPLTSAVATKSKLLTEKKETLLWMQGIHQQPHTGKSPESITDSKLLTVIASQLGAGSLGKFPYQLQQTGAGDIQLSFEKVPYTHILKWLWSLTTLYTVSIKQVHIERTQTPGVIKLTLVIAAI